MGFVTWTLDEMDGSSLGLYPPILTKTNTDKAIMRIPRISKRRSSCIYG